MWPFHSWHTHILAMLPSSCCKVLHIISCRPTTQPWLQERRNDKEEEVTDGVCSTTSAKNYRYAPFGTHTHSHAQTNYTCTCIHESEWTRAIYPPSLLSIHFPPSLFIECAHADTPREDATHTPSMHTQIQGKPKTTDDSDEDNDESGYTGSTTGGDSGMEVPLYEIPILRKKETIAEGKGCIHVHKQLVSMWLSFRFFLFLDAEEPEYHFPRPQDPLKTWLLSHTKNKLNLNLTK